MKPPVFLETFAIRLSLAISLCCASLASAAPSSTNVAPAVIPIGLDAYRQWSHWPYQRVGMRAYMRSTYDRRGGNEGADASHFLYQLADDYNVTLDVEGAGILTFVRYNHWHGSPWHYVVDGTDYLVQESSTADPTHSAANSVFLPPDLFPPPLAVTWATTKGADLSWVPIPFEKSFRMAYSRTHYGTGYYIYNQFVRGTKLSHPIRAWDAHTPSDKDVLDLIQRAGSDIAPTDLTVLTNFLPVLRPKRTEVLYTLTNAPSEMRKLTFSVPRDQAVAFGQARLRITWDGRKEASVDAPVALFFGAGTLYNRDGREYLVKAFPMYIRFPNTAGSTGHWPVPSGDTPDGTGGNTTTQSMIPNKAASSSIPVGGSPTGTGGSPVPPTTNVELACYFPMPFFHSAEVKLTGANETVSNVTCAIGYEPFNDPPAQVGYFHATYRDHPQPEPGKDLVLLDTRETEGGGDWSGNFVGTSFIFSDRANLNTLEGDPRFFFDDSQTPQDYGTGTEEWGGGGDYWGGQNMTLPFAGHPTGARNAAAAVNAQDKIESAYRFLLADLMPFSRNAVIRLEHGGTDESTEHYQTVTYWYGAPAASLVKTDELKIGDAASEAAHGYSSPQASASYAITSRYEWGVDTIQGREIYPEQTDYGRKTRGTSEFTLKLNPQNYGVLLRRKLDYAFPNQRAEVYVADVVGSTGHWPVPSGDPPDGTEGSTSTQSPISGKAASSSIPVGGSPTGTGGSPVPPGWKLAGIWYLAGAYTCVYSNPKDELGATQHIVETSNRRFRDDEFLVPLDLTRGRSAIRVRVKFTPLNIPLFPGHPLDELAWSEIRYDAYCFVMPEW